MKGGVTHKIEEAVKALEQGKVKKALYLTDTGKTERHHEIVADAARKCLSNKEQCPVYLQDAAQRLKDTITPPLDDTDLEGVGGMLDQKPHAEIPSDDELYESCEECHIGDAVVRFHEIAEHCGDVGAVERIQKNLGDDQTPPEQWIKTMVTIAEKPSCGEKSYQVVLGELTDYLEGRDSPILKKLEVE